MSADAWAEAKAAQEARAQAAATDPLALVRALDAGASLEAVEAALRALAAGVNGDLLRRATMREGAVALLGKIDAVSSPARLVDAALAPAGGVDTPVTAPGILQDIEPAEESVHGRELLAGIAAALGRFVVLPDGAAEAAALWILHAHALDAAQVSPTLAFESATKRCGKTLGLELVGELVPRRLPAANITPAAVFRSIEKFSPTLLCDEADTFIRDSDELRGVLNSSHRRSLAFVVRCDGEDMTPRTFSTWCAKAVALIGSLPPTLEDRAITVKMRRKAPGERVERYRPELHAEVLHQIARQAARWAADHLDELRQADPAIPGGLHDRAADNWRPLLAIADAAGGEWPARARQAAVALSGDADSMEMAELLLADLRDLFRERGVDRLPSSEIAAALVKVEERPWPEYGRTGKPLTVRQLARMLAGFDVHPRVVRCGTATPRGYVVADLRDAFDRYLPGGGAHDPQQRNNATSSSVSGNSPSATGEAGVADEETAKRNGGADCCGVADETGEGQGEGGADDPGALGDDWRRVR